MRVARDILGLIGRTPMVELRRIAPEGVRLLAKLESFNPGGSVKDRIGIAMIEEAERQGRLKPGDTIVEPTSGNTGIGLALAAIVKGYHLVCTMPDKMSREKVDLLRAHGAEVVICPTAVAPEDPRSYYSVARRIARERGGFLPNQYENMANPQAHYRTTGPEIWEQTAGCLDAFVCGVGTGGTISGAGRFLKEQDPRVKVVGVDPEGSMIYTQFYGRPHDVHPYLIEGIGEDLIPKTLDMGVLDEIVRVRDKESYLMSRRLLREEGIFTGSSGGAAVLGALRYAERLQRGQGRNRNRNRNRGTPTLVVLIPDSGRNYLGKAFNDDWMREQGFLD